MSAPTLHGAMHVRPAGRRDVVGIGGATVQAPGRLLLEHERGELRERDRRFAQDQRVTPGTALNPEQAS